MSHEELIDLFRHQEWADATLWSAVLRLPAAAEDSQLRQWLHHPHHTQRAFLQIWKGLPIEDSSPDDFPKLADLKEWGRSNYPALFEFLGSDDRSRWQTPLDVPWFKNFPVRPTILETMYQVIMHSAQHRGQNALRLRSLGGQPPIIDYIKWVIDGRPAAEWES